MEIEPEEETLMKRKPITVEGIKLTIPVPESLSELRQLVTDDEDLLYLAYRKWEQSFRMYLLQAVRREESIQEIKRRVKTYLYHRGRR